MKKLFGALVYLITFLAPALIVQYYSRFVDPMTPSEIKMATIAGTVAMIVLAVITGAPGKNKSVKNDSVPKKTGGQKKGGQKTGGQKTRVVRDPGSGAETLFHWNEKEGVWESDHGTILDDSRTREWEQQRLKDRQWSDEQMGKLQNRDTAFDRDMDELKRRQEKELAEMEKEMEENRRFGDRHGRYDLTKEEREEFIRQETEREAKRAQEYMDAGNYYDNWVTGLEWVQWGADFAMDICDVLTLGAGRPIKNIYIASRNTAGDMMDCLINKKDVGTTVLKSLTKTTVDLTQANVNKLGYKYVANGLGDAVKGGIEAGENGESVVGGFVKGGLKGTVRTGIDHGLSKVKMPWTSKSQQIAQNATSRSSHILGLQQSGQLSEKVANGLRNKIRTEAAQKICAENGKTRDLLSNGLGRLSDGIINMF